MVDSRGGHAGRGCLEPVAGLYSSAVARPPPPPPATSTCPLGTSVAVWLFRGVAMLPVISHVPEVCAGAFVAIFAITG
jgi:hypothetical protein